MLLVVLAVVGVLAVGALVALARSGDDASPAASSGAGTTTTGAGATSSGSAAADQVSGDCVTVTKSAMSATIATVGCDDPAGTYVVGPVFDGDATCPAVGGTAEATYTTYQSGTGLVSVTDVTSTLCLALNLVEGQCYKVSSLTAVTAAPCQEPAIALETYFRVEKRVDGATDDGACPAGSSSQVYPEPQRLYCLGPVPKESFTIPTVPTFTTPAPPR